MQTDVICPHCQQQIQIWIGGGTTVFDCSVCGQAFSYQMPVTAAAAPPIQQYQAGGVAVMAPPVAPPVMVSGGEVVLFNRAGVFVSDARFSIPGQTHPIRSISSVRLSEHRPSQFWPKLFAIISAIFILPGPVVMLFTGDFHADVWILLAIGAAMIAPAIALRWRKPDYFVMLRNAAQELAAFKSKDKQLVSEIGTALNDAIVIQSKR